MLIYEDNNELLLPKMKDYKDISNLKALDWEAKTFKGKNDRFYHIDELYTFKRDRHHITNEALVEEAKRQFNIISAIKTKNKQYTGYKMNLDEYPITVCSYQILNPNINGFFRTWDNYKSYSFSKKSCYDLSRLFGGLENLHRLNALFNEQDENFKQKLYENFSEFAIFYYEIFPYLKIIEWSSYDVTKLKELKEKMTELNLNTAEVDFLLNNLEIANNNSLVMKLIKKKS